MDDIPIDPELLAEEREGGGDLDDALVEIADDSSGFDDDSDDAYVDENEESLAGPSAIRPSATRDDDVVFSRLAGVVGRSGEQGKMELSGLDIRGEIAKADKDAASSSRPPPRRAAKRKTRRQHKPSHEVSILIGRANRAYAANDTAQTISLFTEIIRHDPYVISAWNTLASVLEEEGKVEEARHLRFCAAHVEDEADTWKELASLFRSKGQIDVCVYCLRKALSKDQTDLAVLFELASIYRLKKEASQAVEMFKKILKNHPPSVHDFTFLSTFHQSIHSAKQVRLAASAFRTAFDWHLTRTNPGSSDCSMNLQHIIQLVDDLIALEQLEEAVMIIRRGQRWLQGRKAEVKWDTFDDDREYYPLGYVQGEAEEQEGEAEHEGFPLETPFRHRLAKLRLRMGDDDEAMVHIDEILGLDVLQYHDVFSELGTMLLRRGFWAKAKDCLAVIQECDALPDDPKLIYNIAVCQHEMGDNDEALDALKWVVSVEPSNLDAKYLMAQVYDDLNESGQALELITEFIQQRASQDEPITKTRMPREYRKISRAEREGEKRLTKAVLADQMKQKMQLLWEEVQAAEAEIGEGVAGALDRFISAGGTMVENFRMARSNFGKNKGVVRITKQRRSVRRNDLTSRALALQDRLERALGFEDEEAPDAEKPSADKSYTIRVTEFYGLGAEDWLNLIIKYCSVLMVKDEEDVAMDILEHVITAGLFQNRRCEVALRMMTVACAIRIKSYDRVVDHCKRIAQLHQFRMEPFLLILGALSAGGQKASAAFQVNHLQKYLHRDLEMHDDLVKGHKLVYSKKNGRWRPIVTTGVSRRLGDEDDLHDEGDDDESETSAARAMVRVPEETLNDEEEERDANEEGEGDSAEVEEGYYNPRPTRFSPTLNALYGQCMLSAKAYQSALFYFFRAYEQVQQDPLLCFMIAQAFFGRAMNRQSDNRNFQITQGMAFLTRYRKFSPKDDKSLEEVEYNYARAFHGIGVPHLAMKHYELVLSSVKRRMDDAGPMYAEEIKDGSLACEAAHNLIQLYAAVGNMELVRQKSAWLAI